MNRLFTARNEFVAAIQAVAAEAGVPSSLACIVSEQDEDFDGEAQWQMRFNQDGPIINIVEHVDPYADEEEDRSYRTSALLERDKADSAYSYSRNWPRRILFDLREKLIPDYSNAVVTTPDGWVWRIIANGVVRELKVELHSPEHPNEHGDFSFDLDTPEANAFFEVQSCNYDEYYLYEKAVEKSAEKFVIQTYWFSGDGDSFGPLIRCAKFHLADGVKLHASYG